jgi:hypothetical protein
MALVPVLPETRARPWWAVLQATRKERGIERETMSKHKSRTNAELILKLIGPVTAVGDSGVDEQRLHNLDEMIDVTFALIFEIERASHAARRPEASMKKIGRKAQLYLAELKSQI